MKSRNLNQGKKVGLQKRYSVQKLNPHSLIPYQNLAHLERRLGVVISPNGNHVTIKGPPETAEQAGRVLKTLYGRAKAGAAVTLGEVDGAIEESNVQRSLFPADNAGKASFDAIVTRKRGPVRARNAAQDAYLRAAEAQRAGARRRPGRHRQDLARGRRMPSR